MALLHHRKFRRLAQRLGSVALARGVLALLWDAAADRADDVVGTAADVETFIGWTGTPGALVEALVEAGQPEGTGFLEPIDEPSAERRYRLHDYWMHAPLSVRRRRPGRARPAADGAGAPSVAGVLVFPVVGPGEETWALTAAHRDQLRAFFPGVDVDAELLAALAWTVANPTQRKTARGMPRFLTAWLTRAQNRARGGGPPRGPAPPAWVAWARRPGTGST